MDSHVLRIPQTMYSLFRSPDDKKRRTSTLQTTRCYYRDQRRFTKATAGLPALLTEGFDYEQIYGMTTVVSEADSKRASEYDTAELMKEMESAEFVQDWGSSEQEGEDGDDDDNADEQDEDSDVALSSDEEHEKEIRRIASKILGDSNDSDDFEDMVAGDDDEEEMSEEMDIGDEDEEDEEEAEKEEEMKTTSKKHRKSEVDDEFFKLDEMENFLNEEDRKAAAKNRKNEDGEEEEEDLLEEEDSEEDDGKPIMYQDFFDPPAADEKAEKKRGRRKAERDESQEEGQDDTDDDDDDDEDEDEDDDEEDRSMAQASATKGQLFDDDDDDAEEDDEEMSFHDRRNKKVKASLERQESALVQEQSWQMTGEALARSRPESSLLEINLHHTSAVPADPEMTSKSTDDLESWIKQRIKDKAWDDVERKVKPEEDSFQYRKRLVLDSQKSSKSLMAEYEDMYRQQIQPQAQEEEMKDPKKEAIQKSMRELFQQLDALSHFKYTPRKPASEIRIINNTPALAQEEVAPVGMSDAVLVAPEEVLAPLNRDLKAKSERTTTDRKRERRLKKVHQQKKYKAEEKREKTGKPSKAKNKKEREKMLKGLSKKFRGVTVLKS